MKEKSSSKDLEAEIFWSSQNASGADMGLLRKKGVGYKVREITEVSTISWDLDAIIRISVFTLSGIEPLQSLIGGMT